MYLFSRISTADPHHIFEATAFATEVAATVSTITGFEVKVWSVLYGAPLGTIAWTTVVPSLAANGAASEKLLADPGYVEQVTAGRELFATAPEDQLVDMVAIAGDGGHEGDYASLVLARSPQRSTAPSPWSRRLAPSATSVREGPGARS